MVASPLTAWLLLMPKSRKKRKFEGLKEFFKVLQSVLLLTGLGSDAHKFLNAIFEFKRKETKRKRKLNKNKSKLERERDMAP